MIDDLVNDLVRDEGSVKTERGRHIVYDCPAGLKTIQKAVYNMAFNLGITRLSKFKNMIAALEEGNYDKASIEAEDSKWFEQTKSRAQRIVLLMKEAGGKFYD